MGLPKIKTSSELRENLSETINEVNDGVDHIISHKSGNVVLISETHYAKILKENEDLKQIAIGISEIDSGKGILHTKAKSKLQSLKKKWS
ncbi:MAG: type II toxin-antitoxin system prevent-host-death family antitoxin [Bacteriovorax sp.]|jgi:prevent-host-death family protein